MEAEGDIPKRVSGMIPHFWFDILGRIVPGGFLLVGLFSEDWHQSLTSFVHKFAADFPLTTHSVGFFLLFAAASFFVGHFLGVLSYYIIAWPIAFIWPVKEESVGPIGELPLPQKLITCLKSFATESDKKVPSKAIWNRPRIRSHNLIAKQSEAIAHWLWIRSPELAILVSRWSADSLAGRSVALASGILLIVKWSLLTCPIKVVLFTLFLCGVSTHYHYRNKAITRAFYFSAMFESNPAGESPPSGTARH